MYGTLVSKLVARGQGNIIILELGLLQHDLLDIYLEWMLFVAKQFIISNANLAGSGK